MEALDIARPRERTNPQLNGTYASGHVRENALRVELSEITKNQQRQSPKPDTGVAASPEPKTTTDHATTGQHTQNPVFSIR